MPQKRKKDKKLTQTTQYETTPTTQTPIKVKYDPKHLQYDWLAIPLWCIERDNVGKQFKEPIWEKRFNEMLSKGYEVHSFSISSGHVFFLFVKNS